MEEDQPPSAMHEETCSQPLQVSPYYSAPNAFPKGTKRLILQSDLLTEQCKILEKFSLLGCVSGGTLPHAELVQWACVRLHSSFQSIEMRGFFPNFIFKRPPLIYGGLPSQCTSCRSLGHIIKDCPHLKLLVQPTQISSSTSFHHFSPLPSPSDQ